MQWLRHAWSNGERALILATVYMVGASGILISSLLFQICGSDPKYSPLENINPQHVENPVVPQGGILTVIATKCADEATYYDGRIWFIRTKPSIEIVPYKSGQAARLPGCETREYANVIPEDLDPGIWRMEGVDIAQSGTDIQREPWYTEPFEIVPVRE